jgi:hypothetical protein
MSPARTSDPLIWLPADRRLVPLSLCALALGEDMAGAMARIEDGRLPVAWDIRSPGARRREVRVWRGALIEALGLGPAYDPRREPEELALPERDVRSTELQRWWCCGQQLIRELRQAGLLRAVRAPLAETGPNAFWLIDRASAVRFLASRRL